MSLLRCMGLWLRSRPEENCVRPFTAAASVRGWQALVVGWSSLLPVKQWQVASYAEQTQSPSALGISC